MNLQADCILDCVLGYLRGIWMQHAQRQIQDTGAPTFRVSISVKCASVHQKGQQPAAILNSWHLYFFTHLIQAVGIFYLNSYGDLSSNLSNPFLNTLATAIFPKNKADRIIYAITFWKPFSDFLLCLGIMLYSQHNYRWFPRLCISLSSCSMFLLTV